MNSNSSNNKIKISSNRSFGLVFFLLFIAISFFPLLKNEEIKMWSLLIGLILLPLFNVRSESESLSEFGVGKENVTSKTPFFSIPRSMPVARLGMDSVQCFVI